MEYLSFAFREKRILTFGLSFTFFSSFGQTFLISLFLPYFLQTFQLTNAGFGSLYSIATLSSAAILPWLGRGIDHLPLKRYSLYVATGLLVASATMALSWHISLLFAGLLMLRLAGQGLSGHTAQTAMARGFVKERGKALSISSMGYSIGEGILPMFVAFLLTMLSWRMTWGVFAAVIGLVLIPLILFVLRDGNSRRLEAPVRTDDDESRTGTIYRALFSSGQFWLLIPAVLLPAFWATALFLYQILIAGQLGWSATLTASAFTAYAASRTLCSIGIGPMIDRWTARTIFPYYVIPFGVGLLVALWHPGSWSSFLYMALLGVTMGMGSPIRSALWVELYGEEAVGTIRSLFSALMVFSTALSPFLIGWLLDYNVTIPTILTGAIASIVIGFIMAGAALSINRDSISVT